MRVLLVRIKVSLYGDTSTNHTPLELIMLLDLPKKDLNVNGRGLERV